MTLPNIKYELAYGSHASPEEGLCAMEFVALLAGEDHSDAPVCVDPPLRRFSIGLNDRLPDDLRQELRPYLARCIGTADDGRTEERRWLLVDFAVRIAAAEAQEVAGFKQNAERLRSLPRIVDRESGQRAAEVCREVRAAAPRRLLRRLRRPAAAAAYAAAAASAASYAASYAASVAAADADAYYAAYAAAAADAAAYAADADASHAMWDRLMPHIRDLYEAMLPTEALPLPEDKQVLYEELLRA